MASVCQGCGSSSVIEEEHGGQRHRVCAECGAVSDSTTCFEQERDFWSSSTSCNQGGSLQSNNLGKGRNIRQGDPNAPSRQLKPWIEYLKRVCSRRNLNTEMERGAVDLFSRAYSDILKHKQRAKKQALCGAVVFTICRQYDLPVFLSEIAAEVQSTVKELFAVKQLLVTKCNQQIPNASIEEIVETVLKKYGFVDPSFIAKSVEVVGLARDVWITCGRSHDAVIVAAAFLVWKASPEGRGKGKQLAAFHQRLSHKPPGQTRERIKEMQSILMQLLKKVPWLKTKSITLEMTTKYLDDVLKTKKYLISCVEAPKELDSSDEAESATTETANTDETSRLLWTPGRKRKHPPNRDQENIKHHCYPLTSASSADPLHQALVNLGEELTEKDIPESEMHMYVRSDTEVAEILRLQTLVPEEETLNPGGVVDA